ncbi:hypothetical protein ANAPH1_00873 [Anaplasma phagocytophilum]|uniref:Uncharacterized protein n=2 Tax=Anaplasma phagocytophilum TaxID=948 RepID=A0A0F3NBK4_ANAPH|nr:hypothetical protein APHMUC_0794 [Anaplasma phagocytophilum str. ApMUC09]SCV65721.1 hypothetical protein ANAPH1_00873 [Anaplasma phagocytophilum]
MAAERTWKSQNRQGSRVVEGAHSSSDMKPVAQEGGSSSTLQDSLVISAQQLSSDAEN